MKRIHKYVIWDLIDLTVISCIFGSKFIRQQAIDFKYCRAVFVHQATLIYSVYRVYNVIQTGDIKHSDT